MQQLIRLLRYIRPYSLQFFLSIILMAIVGLLDAFRVLLIGPIFDQVLNPGAPAQNITLFQRFPGFQHAVYLQQFIPKHFHNPLTVVAVALVGATIIKGLCDYLGTYLVSHAGYGLVTDLRNDLYNGILKRSTSFFSRYPTGKLVSTVINDVEKIQFALSTVMAEFLQQFFTLLFTALVVVALGGKLAWVLLIFIPFVIVSAGKIGLRVRQTTRKGQDKLSDIQNILHETITGNRIVKAFSMEAWESRRFFAAAKKLFKANLRSVRAQAISSPLMDMIGAAAIAILLWLGRNQIKSHYFTPGVFFGFIIAVFKLYDPVRKFALFNNSFQQVVGASSEIFRFMDEEEEIREKPEAVVLSPFHDKVQLENVRFSYSEPNGHTPAAVLRSVNLEVHKGEVVAIVVSSGAGKSTLVQLIPRFFDVTAGAIKIDGHDVRDVTLASLRAQVGVVTQETILFNDTVRNNIAYGQPDVSSEPGRK